MATPIVAGYGSWQSPITSELIVAAAIRLGHMCLDGEDVYWIEERPGEGGRSVVVHRDAAGGTRDITPRGFDARTTVHEYGGGDFTVADGIVYFSNQQDQRIYRQGDRGQPRPITPPGSFRYADAVVDRRRRRLICVREDHESSHGKAINTLVVVDLEGASPVEVLVGGNDFYSSPRLSPDGQQLAWLTWNHPNMPWDGTELWVGRLGADGRVEGRVQVAGGAAESIFQPEWSSDGSLYFISDRSGWGNIYRCTDVTTTAVCVMDAEFGMPQWRLGMSSYACLSDGRIACARGEGGVYRLSVIEKGGALLQLGLPYTWIGHLRAAGRKAVVVAGAPLEESAVVEVDLQNAAVRVLRRSREACVDKRYLSTPQAVAFPTYDGQTAHAFYYQPNNEGYAARPGDQPPLLVKSHGGPTGASSTALNLSIQYWTSRGFAVLDVNYSGSVGYGRAYRERLDGQWGIRDVADCLNGARYLAQRGEVDAERMAISGGSAGGYTTLCSLTFHSTFRAGASYYGVGDLETLARDTHKFESRYLDRLIGPYPARRDLYVARSPIHFTERLSCPVIIFQGLDDKVVPPNQAEQMVQALRAKRLPFAYVTFSGEGHGFRRADNIKRALDAELYFYSRVFAFDLADRVAQVAIENL